MSSLLRVSSNSSPTSVAGAIAGFVKEDGEVELQCIGAAAVNQATKAIAISRGYVASNGLDLICTPAFIDVEIDGEERTAIRFTVEPRS